MNALERGGKGEMEEMVRKEFSFQEALLCDRFWGGDSQICFLVRLFPKES